MPEVVCPAPQNTINLVQETRERVIRSLFGNRLNLGFDRRERFLRRPGIDVCLV